MVCILFVCHTCRETPLPSKRMLIRQYRFFFVCGYYYCVDDPIIAIIRGSRSTKYEASDDSASVPRFLFHRALRARPNPNTFS
jgi:hypothetical protein